MKNKIISFLTDGIVSGLLICVGCAVALSVESKIAGAFLFSLGLFAITAFKFGLYTGKAGYMVLRPASYILEVVITLIGNIFGTAIGGGLINLTKLGGNISKSAAAVIEAKVCDTPVSMAILAVFCGLLMFIAVEGNRRTAEKGDFVGALFALVMPVMVFIMCGFNHCVADFGYFFIGGCPAFSSFAPYIVIVILGNALGCNLIPLFKKFSMNKL